MLTARLDDRISLVTFFEMKIQIEIEVKVLPSDNIHMWITDGDG